MSSSDCTRILNIDLTNAPIPTDGPAEFIIKGIDCGTSTTTSSTTCHPSSTRSSTTCPTTSSSTCSPSSSSSISSSSTCPPSSSSSYLCKKDKKEKEKGKKDKKEKKYDSSHHEGVDVCTITARCGNIRKLESFSLCSQTVNTRQLVVDNQLVNPNLFLPPSLNVSTLFGADANPPEQKPVTLANEIPIPQGVYTGTPLFPVINTNLLPNYYSLMSTENQTVLSHWQRAVRIHSQVYIKNISTNDTLQVAFLLMAYSRNPSIERVDILDMDIHTLYPGDLETFRVDWFIGKSTPLTNATTNVTPIITSTTGLEILLTGSAGAHPNFANLILPTVNNPCLGTLPFINGVTSAAIFTAVSIVGAASNLGNLRTYALAPDTLRRNIFLYFRNLPSCGNLCTSSGCLLCPSGCLT